MVNKKSKFLFYISCLLLLSAVSIFLGLHFQAQPVYAVANEAEVIAGSVQNDVDLSASDIFENYTQTSLKKEYRDKTVLDLLKENNEISVEEYDRAIDVLKGNARFISEREFSTEFENDNKIDQVGDIARYSKDKLKCIWAASELILTGIYGMPDYTFNVFVEANDATDELPYIIFSQNHGYYAHWYEKIKLKKGMNILTFPTFGLGYIAKEEIRGGAVYLCNPYLPAEQGEVNVYIEGGGYYPVFRKGGNEEEFLNFLDEYESEREAKGLLDMAELITDHAIISTTSSSLYDVYFNNDVITPSENLNLWGNYFTAIFEFNGIPTSEFSDLDVPYDERNDYVKINFRYMTYYQGSGAYSYSYHIGWYYEHYWFADFYHAKQPIRGHELTEHLLFGIGHELGHALDNEPRKINETTNNFTAAMAYFKIVGMPQYDQYHPFEKTLAALSNDYKLNYKAYDDGQIMYTKANYPTNYDHNYMIWWDLEAVFPGFWAKFNNYFRGTLETGLSMEEKYVYYSSLAAKVDLSDYYERWGFYYGKSQTEWNHRFVYGSSSDKFKNLMEEARNTGKIAKLYDHFWYADGAQYDFSLEHQNVSETDKTYNGGKPSISKIIKSNNERTIYIQGLRDKNHLGYEVMSKVDGVWKIVGFTYGSSFTDQNYYSSDPTYKVVAINRYFNQSEESSEFSIVSSEAPSVCRIDQQYFNTLEEALTTATDGQTIYLLSDCKLKYIYLLKNLTIEIDPSVQNDICIDENDSYLHCQNNLTIRGRDNAKIIIEGNSKQSTTPVIYGVGEKFIAENVIFRNLRTKYLAAVIYAPGMDVELLNCDFVNCKDLKADGIVRVSHKLKIENCSFAQVDEPCVNISNLDDLTLSREVNDMSIIFDDFDDVRSIKLEDVFADDISKNIKIKDDYMMKSENNRLLISKLRYDLKFHGEATIFDYEANKREFEFGTEQHEYGLSDNQYVEYEERVSGKKYRTGDKIVLNDNMEFYVKVKDKIRLKFYYKNGQSSEYCAYEQKIYLPTVDESQNQVIAYKDADRIYNAGQMYVVENENCLVAIYKGYLTYRFFVKCEVVGVGYGAYGQSIDLLRIEDEGFLGWQYGAQFASDSVSLKGDADLIAVFSEDLPEIYDLELCEIHVDGIYVYSGEKIVPSIIVYYKGLVVPSVCYSVTCFDNIAASDGAQVMITFAEGLSTGSKTQTFTILPKRLGSKDIDVTGLRDFVYSGAQTEQSLSISYQNEVIDDFSVEYIGDRINVGNVQVKIVFFGNYSGDVYLEYSISKAAREGFSVSLDDWVYGEDAPSPSIQNIKEEAAITYSYSNAQNGIYTATKPMNAGNYWIKAEISASQNYESAEAKAQFTIEKAENPAQIPDTTMTVARKIKVLRSVVLIDGWKWESPDTKIDEESICAYAVYSDIINYKNYRVLITINKEPPKEVSQLSVMLEENTFVYDGTLKTPKIIVQDGNSTLVLGTDYDVRYQDNILVGQGKAIVTFENDYSGTKELSFTIVKAKSPNIDTNIRFQKKATKLSDIPLPDGFVWEDAEMEVMTDRMTAKAIYVGADADCYEIKEIYCVIVVEMHSDPGSVNLIWLAVVIPFVAFIMGFIVYGIVKYKRKKQWEKL